MLELFFDQYLTQPVDVINFDVVEAGTSKRLNLFLHNDSANDVEQVTYECDDEHVFFESIPDIVPSRSSIPITLVWKPPLDLKKALNTNIEFKGFELIKP